MRGEVIGKKGGLPLLLAVNIYVRLQACDALDQALVFGKASQRDCTLIQQIITPCECANMFAAAGKDPD
jgi:hypothetical protein